MSVRPALQPAPDVRAFSVLTLFLVMLWAAPVAAQEFRCDFSIDVSQIPQAGIEETLADLEQKLEQYFNEQTWTEDRYETIERINCNGTILFNSVVGASRFRASFILTSSRPIYGTLQTTTLLQIRDDEWEFDYVQGTPLVFDPQRFNALTSLLNFYAYLMLGYDYDSFGELGGTRFFEAAREITAQAQSINAFGWTTFGSDRGKTQLITQLLDPRYVPLRRAYYAHHHLGLDHFVQQPDSSRATVLASLQALSELYDQVSKQYALDIFFTTKSAEIVGMLERSSLSADAYALLANMDPSRLNDYNRLIN